MKKIGFLFTQGRKKYIESARKGEMPADFFYNALELQKRGYQVDIIEDADIGSINQNLLIRFLSSKLSKIIGINFYQVYRLNRKNSLNYLNNFDIVVATTNTYGISLATLKYLKRFKPQVIFMTMGVMPLKSNFIKRCIFDKIFRNIYLAPLSKNEKEFILNKLNLSPEKVTYLPFGIDPNFWKPVDKQANYVLSVGTDASRDYELLIKNWKREYPLLKILTGIKINFPIPNNVQIIVGDPKKEKITRQQLREMIHQCLFVIIPIKNTIQPSGQSTCSQAMACGKIVIMSDIDGLWDKDVLKNNVNIFLIKPGSSKDLQEKVNYLLKKSKSLDELRKTARETILHYFTIQHSTQILEGIIKKIK